MQMFKTTLLLGSMTLLMIIMGGAIGHQGGMAVAFIMALVMNFMAYWFSDKIVLRMHGAMEIGENDHPQLYSIVRELAARAGLPMPKVYIIPDDSPNAFATGRNPEHAAVAATEGILRILSPTELSGVMAHELAHVQNRDILISTIAASLAGAISMVGNMLQWGAMFGGRRDDEEGNGLIGLVGTLALALLAPFAASLIQMAVSRSREYAADAGGAKICGDPDALASALNKLHRGSQSQPLYSAQPATAHMFIVNPLSAGMITSLFSTHPPMEERIARLRKMPH